MLSRDLKNLNDAEIFKFEIRELEPKHFKCKIYLSHIHTFIYLFTYFYSFILLFLSIIYKFFWGGVTEREDRM